MKKLTTLLLCLGLMLTYACQDDRYDTDQNRKGGVTAKLNLHTPDYTQVGTRFTNESAIMDVTILQFINGKLAKKITMDNKYWGATVETTDLDAMPASTLDANGALVDTDPNVMVFLANFKGGFDDYLNGLTLGSTYTNFQAATASLDDATADGLAALESVPMTGFYYGGVTKGITNQINVTVTRALAKINFTLNTANFQVDGKPATVTVKSIELRNVPLEVTFFESNRPSLPIGTQPGVWAGQIKRYPATVTAAGGTGLPRFDASNFTKLELAHNQSATPLTNFVAYMPENVRGSFTGITVNKDKHPDATVTPAIPAGNNVGWTYIYVDLHYVNDDGLTGDAQYCIYLGGDAAGDMNILSGVQYNVTTNLYGANDSDTRITVQHGFDPRPDPDENDDVEILKQANSYIINNTDLKIDDKPLVLPLTQARKGWQYIQASLNDGTNYVDDLDALISSGNWEIVTLWKTQNSDTNIKGASQSITTVTGNTGLGSKYYAQLSPHGAPLTLGHNYVIALRSTADNGSIPSGTIWWTWHLWFTDYQPGKTMATTINGQVHTYKGNSFGPAGVNYNRVMMDRHLGATGSVTGNATIAPPATLADAEKWYGLLYQWGNKNPFTPNSLGNNTIAGATAIYDAAGNPINAYDKWTTPGYDNSQAQPQSGNSVDGFPKISNATVSGVVANRLLQVTRTPFVYYFNAASPYDWTTQDNNLWSPTGVKTVFDPCPPGWRLPASGSDANSNVWAGFSTGDWGNVTTTAAAYDLPVFSFYSSGVVNATTHSTAGRYYNDGTTKAWYPASGYRDRDNGAFNGVGAYGFSWSASVNGTNGFYLEFYSTVVRPQHSNRRALGFPVRCLSE